MLMLVKIIKKIYLLDNVIFIIIIIYLIFDRITLRYQILK